MLSLSTSIVNELNSVPATNIRSDNIIYSNHYQIEPHLILPIVIVYKTLGSIQGRVPPK